MDQSNRQFMEKWSMGWQQNQQQQAWQGQDMTRERGRQQIQFGWQEQDLAFQGAQTSLQFGWQSEDFERNKRFATGRQRRDLMRQHERATISYGMQMGQLETQEGRLKTREQWAEEDFNKEQKRFEQRKTWAEQELQLQLKHHTEDVKLQNDQFGVTVDHFKTVTGFEEKLRVLQVKYQDDQYKMQAAELEHQKTYIKLQQQIDEAQTALGEAQQLQLSEFRAQFESGGLLKDTMAAFVKWLTESFAPSGPIAQAQQESIQIVLESTQILQRQVISQGVVGGGRIQ
jgi:hypothetical protein